MPQAASAPHSLRLSALLDSQAGDTSLLHTAACLSDTTLEIELWGPRERESVTDRFCWTAVLGGCVSLYQQPKGRLISHVLTTSLIKLFWSLSV